MSKEVILVSGLSSKGQNLAPLRYVAEHLHNGQVTYVDGAHINEFGDLEVSSPSDQATEITRILESNPKKDYTIVSHSMGALAGLNCIENFQNATAISIAPPLLHPITTLYNQRLLNRLLIRDTGLVLPSYSFALGDEGPSSILPAPVDTNFSPAIFDEIAQLSDGYFARTNRAILNKRLSVVMPSEDWNISALSAAAQLEQVHYISAPHSLQTGQDLLKQNASAIASIAEQF